MKKIALILLSGLSSISAFSQSAEEIVAKYIAKNGGKENMEKLKTVKMTGLANSNGMEFPMTILMKGKSKFKSFVTFQGMDIVQPASYDGNEVWNTNVMTMKNEILEGEAAESIKREALDFPDPFLTYSENGYEIELEGEKEIDGVSYIKLNLIKPDQTIMGQEVSGMTEFLLDPKTYFIVSKTQNSPMGSLETLLSDYRNIDGIMYPFKMETKIGGNVVSSVIMDSVEINVPIDDSLFTFPD